jgi:hypothetical protein
MLAPRCRVKSFSGWAAASFLTATLALATATASHAAPKVSLRWHGHTVRAHSGQPGPCPQDKRARQRALPVRRGAWLTVISFGPWKAINVQLGRVAATGYRPLGPFLDTIRRPHGRWRVTIGSVRRANVLIVEAVQRDESVARFHVCLTR